MRKGMSFPKNHNGKPSTRLATKYSLLSMLCMPQLLSFESSSDLLKGLDEILYQ